MTSSLSSSSNPWPRRVVALCRFSWRFLRALWVSNLQLVRVVLFRPNRDLAPGFIPYPCAGLSPFEIIVLSHCITLTPGTTSVEGSPKSDVLMLHALDARHPEAVIAGIKQELEAPLVAWTR